MSELSQNIWSGSLNVCVVLSPSDSNQMMHNREIYLTVNRNSYFPLYYPKLLGLFEPYLLVPGWAASSEWWLEYEEVPLKWNYPIGLLYDFLTGLDPQKRQESTTWKLILHYRNYPDDYILPFPDYKTLESHWVNQVKESCYIQHGTSKPVMILSKQDSSELWSSVQTHDFNKFWSIMPKITGNSSKKLKTIPLRLYLSVSDKVINLPIEAYNSEGDPTRLGEALHKIVPDLFPSTKNYIMAKPVLHGVTIPLDIALTELFRETLYVDGFLHMSIVLIA